MDPVLLLPATMNAAALREPAVSLDARTPIDAAARLMRETGARELIVVESRCRVPIGLITEPELAVDARRDGHCLTLVDIGDGDLVTVDEDDHIATALWRMRMLGVDCLVVVDASGAAAGVLRLERVIEALVTEVVVSVAPGGAA